MAIFSALKDWANSICSYFNNISVTKMQLGKSVHRAMVFQKMPFESRFWLLWQCRGAAKWGKNAFLAIFFNLRFQFKHWNFLKWCWICMYFSLLKNMISCLHILQIFFQWGAQTPPSNPKTEGVQARRWDTPNPSIWD